MTIIIGGGDKAVEPSIILPGKMNGRPAEPNKSYLERGVRKMIDLKFQRSDLFQVFSETHIYQKDSSEYVHDQSSGKIREIVEVKFNGEWLCDISSDMKPNLAYLRILDGLNGLKNKLERRVV